jgi:putative DNA primase/helicase
MHQFRGRGFHVTQPQPQNGQASKEASPNHRPENGQRPDAGPADGDWETDLPSHGEPSQDDFSEPETEAETPPPSRMMVAPLDRVIPVAREWLWKDRIPCGALTLISGASGAGTTSVVLDIAARISRGADFPGERNPLVPDAVPGENSAETANPPLPLPEPIPTPPRKPAKVVFVTCTDAERTALRSRLTAAQAQISNVLVVAGVEAICTGGPGLRRFTLETDVSHFDALLQQHPDVRLIVIDTLEEWSNGASRPGSRSAHHLALKLMNFAQRTNVAIVAVTGQRGRPNQPAVERVAAEKNLVRTADAVWQVAADPRFESRHEFLPVRMANMQLPQGFAFGIDAGVTCWNPRPLERSALELLPSQRRARRQRSEVQEAADWLEQTLMAGPLRFTELRAGLRQEGFSGWAMQEARRSLRLRWKRIGYGKDGYVVWSLPAEYGAPDLPVEGEGTNPDAGAIPWETQSWEEEWPETETYVHPQNESPPPATRSQAPLGTAHSGSSASRPEATVPAPAQGITQLANGSGPSDGRAAANGECLQPGGRGFHLPMGGILSTIPGLQPFEKARRKSLQDKGRPILTGLARTLSRNRDWPAKKDPNLTPDAGLLAGVIFAK